MKYEVSTVTTTNLRKGIVKCAENLKENSIKLALYIAEYSDRRDDITASEIDNEIIELTGLSKSSISVLRKSGQLIIAHPQLEDMEYTKIYELRKLSDEDIDEINADNIKKMSQKDIRNFVNDIRDYEKRLNNEDTKDDTDIEIEEEEEQAIFYSIIDTDIIAIINSLKEVKDNLANIEELNKEGLTRRQKDIIKYSTNNINNILDIINSYM